MNPVGVIEDVHGHKGAVRVRPDSGKEIPENVSAISVTGGDQKTARHRVLEIRKYRRNTYLLKFKGLKWRGEVAGMVNCRVAV